MKKIKEIFLSEKGMEIINSLFFLSIAFYSRGLFIVYIAWIAYLVFCIKHTNSKGRKVAYFSTIVFVVVLNLCVWLRYR